MKIYFAAPLFCQAELDYNAKLTAILRKEGFDVFLPQECPGTKERFADPNVNRKELMTELFFLDLKNIDSSDVLLLVMDGRVPDEGACFELGYAYAKGKKCIGIKTDIRVSEYGDDNAMLVGSLGKNIVSDTQSLVETLKKL